MLVGHWGGSQDLAVPQPDRRPGRGGNVLCVTKTSHQTRSPSGSDGALPNRRQEVSERGPSVLSQQPCMDRFPQRERQFLPASASLKWILSSCRPA